MAYGKKSEEVKDYTDPKACLLNDVFYSYHKRDMPQRQIYFILDNIQHVEYGILASAMKLIVASDNKKGFPTIAEIRSSVSKFVAQFEDSNNQHDDDCSDNVPKEKVIALFQAFRMAINESKRDGTKKLSEIFDDIRAGMGIN